MLPASEKVRKEKGKSSQTEKKGNLSQTEKEKTFSGDGKWVNLLPFSLWVDRSAGSCRSGDSSRFCRVRSPRSCPSSGSPNILRTVFASSSSASRACPRPHPWWRGYYLKVTIAKAVSMKTTILTTIMTNLLRREVRKFKPGESEPLPDGSAGGLNAAARPEEERLTTDKTSKKQEPSSQS